MFKLIIEDDEGKTTVVPLIRDEITIGRKEGNTIRLTERNVSRTHARLVKQNGTIFIEDLTSHNGIRVNGDKIAGRSPLGEGDRVQIGDYQLALKVEKVTPANGINNGAGGDQTVTYARENGVPLSARAEAPTMQTQIVPQSAPGERQPRLVITSRNFAGREYVIDKAAIVIGRTDDNDIVVNHRSISRHHAKITRDGSHFQIVDMQSANGVRVNNEEYNKVELRKGDNIDLGHVRLRFVAEGEDFLFSRDAQLVDLGKETQTKWGSVVGILLVFCVVAGAGWYFLGNMNQQQAQTDVAKKSPAAEINNLLVASEHALKDSEWDTAIQKTDEVLKLDPQNDLARDKRSRAEAEKRNRDAYNAFVAAAAKNDFDSAIASFNDLTPDSIYRGKAQEQMAVVKPAYLKFHLDAAKKAKSHGKCDDARPHVEAVFLLEPDNAEATAIKQSCLAKAAAAANPEVKNTAVAANNEETPPPVVKVPREPRPPKEHHETVAVAPHVKEKPVETEPAPSDADTQKILVEAQNFYVHGQYASAIDVAKKAMRAQPQVAWRIVGASYCYLKDRNGALQAWNKLEPERRTFLKYVCDRQGLTLP